MAEYEKVKQTIVSSFDEYLKGLASEQILRNPEDHKQFHQTINELEDFLDQENDKYCQPITEEERRKKREGDIEEWILKFSFIHREHFGHAPKFIDNAVSLLNKDYWIIIDEYIRPFLDKSEGNEHRINFFNIISCTELTIMYRLPVDHEHLDQQIFLNAIFAIMTGKH